MEYTYRSDVNIAELVDALLVRAHDSNWIVSLKALCVIHALFRGGHDVSPFEMPDTYIQRFGSYFSTCAAVLNLDRFESDQDPVMAEFIRVYAGVLNDRLMIIRSFGGDPAGPHGTCVKTCFIPIYSRVLLVFSLSSILESHSPSLTQCRPQRYVMCVVVWCVMWYVM